MRSNRRLTLPFIVLCLSMAFFACSKYKDAQAPNGSDQLPEEKIVTASVQGRVLDENGDPVQGAAVTSGTASTTTDENGAFSFSNISMSSRFGFVKAAKQGYFTGSRSILTAASSSNFISITLIPRTSKGTFSASGGGTVVVQTGDSVTFDASSVVTAATNTVYTGTVHVYAYYLDPLATDASAHMPGDLRGIDTSGKETMLKSYGMMLVELEGDGGEKLQIAPGKLASLSMKIPDALKATAPATVPLWYFNDTTGRWIEQGAAVKKDGQYCGQTSHFSWWNCDAPVSTVKFSIKLKDQHGQPLAYTRVDLTSPTLGLRIGYTDSMGLAAGLIPKGEVLMLRILGTCGSLVAGVNIGPALTDQDLGTVTVNIDETSLTFTGKVVDCGGADVDSGYVSVAVEGLRYGGKVKKGVFSLTVPRCSSTTTTAKVIVGDYQTQAQSKEVSLSVEKGNVDVGQLEACSATTTYEQYIHVTVNGTTYTMNYPIDSISMYKYADTTSFGSVPVAGSLGNSCRWYVHALTGTGTFSTGYFRLYQSGVNICFQNGTVQCTITQYGAVNDFIVGTLSGPVSNDGVNTVPMTAEFKVRRTQ